jgi:hypothetical protein
MPPPLSVVRLFYVEYGLLRNFRCQSIQRRLDDLLAQFEFFVCVDIGISQRVGNRNGRNNSVRSYGLADRHDRTDVDDRQACTLNLFYHRCTATCAGASGRSHDDCVYAVFFHFCSIFFCKGLRTRNRGSVTDCCEKCVIKFPDFAFFFHLTKKPKRKSWKW